MKVVQDTWEVTFAHLNPDTADQNQCSSMRIRIQNTSHENLYNWNKPAQLIASTRGEKEAALLPLLHVPGEHVLREVVCTDHSQANAILFYLLQNWMSVRPTLKWLCYEIKIFVEGLK